MNYDRKIIIKYIFQTSYIIFFFLNCMFVHLIYRRNIMSLIVDTKNSLNKKNKTKHHLAICG